MTIREKKSCKKCAVCCFGYPCGFSPKEILAVAKFLKTNMEKMLNKFFIIDFLEANDDNNKLFYMCAKRKHDAKGLQIASWSWAFSEDPCIFLDNENLCKIYKTRPKTAKDCKCWDSKRPRVISKERLTKEWISFFDLSGKLKINKLRSVE